VSRNHWKEDEKLKPALYLEVKITKDQQRLLQPSVKDLFMGSIMNDTIGEGSEKKIAKRRVHMFAGNIASYSTLLNSEVRMKQLQEFNHRLAAILGEIRAEQDDDKEKRPGAKKKKDEEVKLKRIAETEADMEKNMN
jgi:hypothetical protein